jgi:uracil-DNA glycosylase
LSEADIRPPEGINRISYEDAARFMPTRLGRGDASRACPARPISGTMSAPCQKTFEATAARLRACRICRDAPLHGAPLPHEPRPVVQGSAAARLLIASQAPGNRAHRSGVPFSDPSGRRLRSWLGLDEAAFYDPTRVAILPMGACFPGLDAKGGDRPPRRECAPAWRADLLAGLPRST